MIIHFIPSSEDEKETPKVLRQPGVSTRLMIVLGSGGHTAEMLSLLKDLDPSKYTHRVYIVSSGDGFSAQKALEFETKLEHAAGPQDGPRGRSRAQAYGRYDICTVPRARRVYQSLLTTPWTSLLSFWSCFRLLRSESVGYPDLIMSNGPGTAVILIFASLLLRMTAFVPGSKLRKTRLKKLRTIYVESWARVRRLSLSGKMLLKLGMVDRFIVQWEVLLPATGSKGEYLGVLV